MTATQLLGAVDAIDRVCDAEDDPAALLTRLHEELRRALPYDALFVSASDPETLLPMGAGLAVGLPSTICQPFWDYEFAVPDFNKFGDLTTAALPAGDLHAATGGRPELSPRWREFKTHGEFDAELRAVLTAGGRGWGLLHVNRDDEHGAFSAEEVAFVGAVAPIVGRALRRAAVTAGAGDDASLGPGMAILDDGYRLVSATPEAVEWMTRIRSYTDPVDTPMGAVPVEIFQVAQIARARARIGDGTVVSTRVRTRTGDWLLVHGSCMADAGGDVGQVAIVLEQAKATDVAPLMVEAYELTPRELEVTRALARGLSTVEIAKELHLSRFTVQDHLKRVYEKVGVASRGELVARLYADQFQPRNDVAHV